jgi:hypothetical protein
MRNTKDSEDYYNMLQVRKTKRRAEDYEEDIEETAWTK